ncbi:hypothetical protein COO91_09636 (plasmid) [Nostoc flagelliforme CCNUN1]|uniref:Uncharacterized protein n=2 Tax=Nostoc flagelliforme TaxID=1306274 RepID=A0A2K8T8Q4_9NOSO|nr:hypothetical protein COO91_09636 [Nostoc flagelliforme CCNUN1]
MPMEKLEHNFSGRASAAWRWHTRLLKVRSLTTASKDFFPSQFFTARSLTPSSPFSQWHDRTANSWRRSA